MQSPFPGMDPFIESCGLWGDFHQSLISEIKNQLARAATERYLVRAEEREYVEFIQTDDKALKWFRPVVTISKRNRNPAPRGQARTAVVESNPGLAADSTLMHAFIEESVRESFVEIWDTQPGRRLVTCIEVLSAANKRKGAKGWRIYRRKRQSLMLAKVNLIEIDLLREGTRMAMLEPWPSSPYTLLVSRGGDEGLCRVWPAYSLKRLPTIPVPLAPPDSDLHLELQPMVQAIYELSRYARSINYRRADQAKLDEEEAKWLKKQLRMQRK